MHIQTHENIFKYYPNNLAQDYPSRDVHVQRCTWCFTMSSCTKSILSEINIISVFTFIHSWYTSLDLFYLTRNQKRGYILLTLSHTTNENNIKNGVTKCWCTIHSILNPPNTHNTTNNNNNNTFFQKTFTFKLNHKHVIVSQ